jgi:hypothetical protein
MLWVKGLASRTIGLLRFKPAFNFVCCCSAFLGLDSRGRPGRIGAEAGLDIYHFMGRFIIFIVLSYILGAFCGLYASGEFSWVWF